MSDPRTNATCVRALWGDPIIKPYPSALRAMAALSDNKCRKPPTVYYCWGEWNHDFLSRLGIASILVDAKPVSAWGSEESRNAGPNGYVNYGMSIWRHKLEAIRLALQTHDAVIWLDADVMLTSRRVPKSYWRVLSQGQPLQAVLRSYRRVQCQWRSTGRTIVPHGAAIYCRDTNCVSMMISKMERYPHYTDEVCMAAVLDDLSGGQWMGRLKYRAAGFELIGYNQNKRHVLPMRGPAVFTNKGRY